MPRREISLSINIVFKAGDFGKDGFKQSPLGQSITYTLFILMKLYIFTPRDCKMLFYHKSYMYIFYHCVLEETRNLYSTSEKEPRSCSSLSGFVKKFNRTRIQRVSFAELALTLTVTEQPLMPTILSYEHCRLSLVSTRQKPQRIQVKTLNTAYFYDLPFTAACFGLLRQPQRMCKTCTETLHGVRMRECYFCLRYFNFYRLSQKAIMVAWRD